MVFNVARGVGIPAVIVAHQGGWDEILLVVGPVAVVVGLLALARRRVRRIDRSDRSDLGGRSPESETTTAQIRE